MIQLINNLFVFLPKALAVETDFGDSANLGAYVNNAMRIITPTLGSVAFLVFIFAGYIYITSQGDESKVGLAKELILGAITGILLLFLINVLKNQIGF